jgi:hypothetical protein
MYKEYYKKVAKKIDFRNGDKVRVVRRAESNELGWDNLWVDAMNALVGEVGEVVSRDNGTGSMISFGDQGFDIKRFPFFVLDIVERKKKKIKFLLVFSSKKTGRICFQCSFHSSSDAVQFAKNLSRHTSFVHERSSELCEEEIKGKKVSFEEGVKMILATD